MTNGCQWVQVIPARHHFTSRSRHANETNQPSAYFNEYNNDLHSVASSTRSDATRFATINRRGLPQHRNHSARNEYHSDGDTRLPRQNSNYSLVLKPSPRLVRRSIPEYSDNHAKGTQLQNLKAWQSTGSLTSVPPPLHGDSQIQSVRRTASNADPRYGHNMAPPVFESQKINAMRNQQKLIDIQSKGCWQNVQNGGEERKQASIQQHRLHRANSELRNPGNWQSLATAKPVSTSTPKSRTVQESFKWSDGGQTMNLRGQPDHNANYLSIQRPPKAMVIHGHAAAPQDNPHLTHPSEALRNRNGQIVPFTKKTGPESQSYFLQLMKPNMMEGSSNKRRVGPVRSLPPKPPQAPNPQMRRFSEQEMRNIDAMNSRRKVMMLEPEDENVIYTEIAPQQLTSHNGHPARHPRLVRSRSSSPVIYTEVIPPSFHKDPAQTGKFIQRNGRRSSKNDNVDGHRVSMTLGDDLSISLSEDQLAQRNVTTTLQSNKSKYDNEDTLSQTPSEFSITLGTPRLQRMRQYAVNATNRAAKLPMNAYDDKTRPFPSQANLDHMLSDSSSKKSGTIKSALKQPSNTYPGMKHSNTSNRTTKRVTIKENINEMTTPNVVMKTSYRTNAASGLTRVPVKPAQDRAVIQSPHKFKVVNRNIVLMS